MLAPFIFVTRLSRALHCCVPLSGGQHKLICMPNSCERIRHDYRKYICIIQQMLVTYVIPCTCSVSMYMFVIPCTFSVHEHVQFHVHVQHTHTQTHNYKISECLWSQKLCNFFVPISIRNALTNIICVQPL